MEFKPVKDYNGLLKQANALLMLVNSYEAQLAYYRALDYTTSLKRLDELNANLESERAMNAQLTNELESALNANKG